jgi:ABC-type uncharacterized transport system ATPase subunit
VLLLTSRPGVAGGRARGTAADRGALAGRVSVLLIEHDMDLVFSFADA